MQLNEMCLCNHIVVEDKDKLEPVNPPLQQAAPWRPQQGSQNRDFQAGVEQELETKIPTTFN